MLRTQSYGEDYVNTRCLRNKIINTDYNTLNNLTNFENKREFCMSIFGLIKEMEKQEEVINKVPASQNYCDFIFNKLISMAGYLEPIGGIIENNNPCIVNALLYFYIINEKQFVLFYKWLKRNCLLSIKDVSAKDLVKVFTSIYENRNRKIFVSLDTREGDDNYNSIKHVVERINVEYKLNLELNRVDKHHDGTSFNIPDTIWSMIEGCGLHIADLTGKNVNVYNEIGYRIGINDTENHGILYILKLTPGQKVEDSIGSNIKMENIKCFSTLEELENILKQELEQRFVNMTTGLE